MNMIDFSRILTAEALAGQEAARDRDRRLAAMEADLARTDWLVLRESETGTPMPEPVREARAALRLAISALRAKAADAGDPLPF